MGELRCQDTCRNLPGVEHAENCPLNKVLEDAVITGKGFMMAGKRIAPEDVIETQTLNELVTEANEHLDECVELRLINRLYAAMKKSDANNILCVNEVSRLNAELKADGWISVDDRLPEELTSVLIYFDPPSGGGYVEESYWLKGKWITEGSNAGDFVTYWMPMPEAPKVKS